MHGISPKAARVVGTGLYMCREHRVYVVVTVQGVQKEHVTGPKRGYAACSNPPELRTMHIRIL